MIELGSYNMIIFIFANLIVVRLVIMLIWEWYFIE